MNANESGKPEPARERLAAIGEIAAEIAHEMSNLIQVMASSAYAARVALARDDARAAQPHVAVIERTARTAHAIVDDLMALARGDALSKEACLVADVLVAARAELAQRAVRWRDDVQPSNLGLHGHPGLLTRLVHALYENAVQASAPRTATVTTRARSSGGVVVVEVADDGPGSAPAVAARLFEPLVTARAGGTGLGLALARRIAEAHGGSITRIESPPNAEEASVFRIVLPA